jgi:hypothetical protein
MKKLIFILIVILFSCEKETQSDCWVCETTSQGFIGTTVVKQYTNSTITEACGMSAIEAIEYEHKRSGTSVIDYNAGFGYIQHVTVIKKTHCLKK